MFEISNIGVLTALAAGAISFLSPCVLPLVPGYISYIAGNSAGRGEPSGSSGGRLSTLSLSAFFVLGFSTIFIALGASATALSRLLLAYRYETNIVGGAIIIVFGVFMTGLVRLPWLDRDVRFHSEVRGGRPLGDPNRERPIRDGFGRHRPSQYLLHRARSALPRIGAVHGRAGEALETDAARGAAAPDRSGWNHDRHGLCHDHRQDVDVGLLAASTVPDIREHRLRSTASQSHARHLPECKARIAKA